MASPSEFLTFFRRAAMHPSIRQRVTIRTTTFRPLSSSIPRLAGDKLSTDDSVNTAQYPDGEHATNKKDKLDIQSHTAAAGQK